MEICTIARRLQSSSSGSTKPRIPDYAVRLLARKFSGISSCGSASSDVKPLARSFASFASFCHRSWIFHVTRFSRSFRRGCIWIFICRLLDSLLPLDVVIRRYRRRRKSRKNGREFHFDLSLDSSAIKESGEGDIWRK